MAEKGRSFLSLRGVCIAEILIASAFSTFCPRRSVAQELARRTPPVLGSLDEGVPTVSVVRLPAAAPDVSKPKLIESSTSSTTPMPKRTAPLYLNRLDNHPVAFIENRGQFDPRVKFQVRIGGKILWLTNTGIVFDAVRAEAGSRDAAKVSDPFGSGAFERLIPRVPSEPFSGRGTPDPGSVKYQRLVFSEQFVGGSASSPVFLNCPQPGIYNYFIGNDPKKWVKDVHAYSQVVYRDVWKGIDISLHGNGPNIEQEFVIHPGADATQIHVAYQGIKGLKIAKDGSLVVHTAFGDLLESKPHAYQEIGGKAVAVEGGFKLLAKAAYTFQTKPVQPKYALVIDPTLLYSTFFHATWGVGCSSFYGCFLSTLSPAIAVDSGGDVYMTGGATFADFPTTAGVVHSPLSGSPAYTAFVTELNPLGSALVYSTLLSGQPSSIGKGIALDSSGEAYVTGQSYGNYPTTPNAYQANCASGGVFVTKLSAAGDSLMYSSCLGNGGEVNGGGQGQYGNAIAVDARGFAYVTGVAGQGFPTTASAFQTIGGEHQTGNAVLAVIDPSASGSASLIYSTYLGGSGTDVAYGVAVDLSGAAYIAGTTTSTDFPVTQGAFQTHVAGPPSCAPASNQSPYPAPNAFVAKFNPAGFGAGSLIYSTYLGGILGAAATGIAVDSAGSAYVTGYTPACTLYTNYSDVPPFPTTPSAFRADSGQAPKPFVTKFNAAGNGLVYSTVIDSSTNFGQASASAIALDSSNDAYIVGTVKGNFPVTGDAYQLTNHGGTFAGYGEDAFLTEINATGNGLIYSTYFGGVNDDWASGLAVDQTGDAYMTGFTLSLDFPITSHAYQPVLDTTPDRSRYGDVFLSKFGLGSPQGLSILGITPTVGGNAGSVTPEVAGSGFHAGATITLTGSGADIVGTGVTVGPEGRIMNATFDLTSAQPGPVDLDVTNPDGTRATLSNAFTIQQGGTPKLRVQKISTPAILGREMTYLITVTNAGTIDSGAVSASEFLQPWFTYDFADPTPNNIIQEASLWPPSVAGTGAKYNGILQWSIPNVPAGSSQAITYTVNLDSTFPAGQTVTGEVCVTPNIGAVIGCDLGTEVPCEAGVHFVCEPLLPTVVPWIACVVAGAATCDAIRENCLHYVETCYPDPTTTVQPPTPGTPFDPNYLAGVPGAGGQGWIPGGEPLSYVVGFGNELTATAPAQQVVVTLPLNSSLNDSDLRLVGITIPSGTGSTRIQVPIPMSAFSPAAGLNELVTNADLRPGQNLLVNIDAKLDPNTNTITWTFTSIDPTTGQPPTDPSVGFLPPGAQANVFFTVTPNAGLPTGTTISAEASVVFSNNGASNPPVNTNIWLNTVDDTPPVSSVAALTADETSSCFKVQWSGTDVGSGIQSFTIFVSDDGEPYTAWQTNTSATSATYDGQPGHEYAFYSQATDEVGNVEAAKTSPEATTTVATTAACGAAAPTLSGRILSRSLAGNTLTVVLQLTNAGSAPVQNIYIDQFGLRTLSGTGAATYPGLLPLFAGSLAAGASETLTLTITVPSTVTKFSLIENGTVQDASGNTYKFSIGQVVYP